MLYVVFDCQRGVRITFLEARGDSENRFMFVVMIAEYLYLYHYPVYPAKDSE